MGQEMFIVVGNTVVVEISAASTGKTAYVDTLSEGEIIGETALFVNAKRTAHVRTADEARVLVLTRPRFFALLKERGKLGIKFLFMIIYGLIGRLRAANEELAFERRSDGDQDDIDDLIAGMVPDEAIQALSNLQGNGEDQGSD
jgi:CRP-like cAMP-binding protein